MVFFVAKLIDAAPGRSALALTFSMVQTARLLRGKQNTPLLLPLRPNRGKANLASRIRTTPKVAAPHPPLRLSAATAAKRD